MIKMNVDLTYKAPMTTRDDRMIVIHKLMTRMILIVLADNQSSKS
jgi:hypothetical protein